MELTRSTKSKINENENGENVPHLEIIKVVLLHCNIVSNNYQQKSRILNTFFPNELFGQLLDTSFKNVIFLKTFNSEFSYNEVRFTNQNSSSLEIEDKINITLVIKYRVKYKKLQAVQFNLEIKYL